MWKPAFTRSIEHVAGFVGDISDEPRDVPFAETRCNCGKRSAAGVRVALIFEQIEPFEPGPFVRGGPAAGASDVVDAGLNGVREVVATATAHRSAGGPPFGMRAAWSGPLCEAGDSFYPQRAGHASCFHNPTLRRPDEDRKGQRLLV